jgi:hypothetical protein
MADKKGLPNLSANLVDPEPIPRARTRVDLRALEGLIR